MDIAHHLALLPRDGFFCKDGRGWHTSSTNRGYALDWPWPSTILGALRTASGRDREGSSAFSPQQWQANARQIALTCLLALRRPVGEENWDAKHRIWPVPQDALWLESDDDEPRPELIRLRPREHNGQPHTLGRDVDASDQAREKLWFPEVGDGAKPLSRPRWWSESAFIKWLSSACTEVHPATPKWGEESIRRVQTRVGIDPTTFTAEESVLFSHDVIETLDRFEDDGSTHEWAIGARVMLPQELQQETVRLGSDSRLAWVETMTAEPFQAPEELLNAFGEPSPGLRLVVVTPAKFQKGWLPSGFNLREDGTFQGQLRGIPSSDVILRSAFVPRPLHVSGWNMTGGGRRAGAFTPHGAPKETQRLVPPGAVYFFERVDGTPFTKGDAEKLWLAGLGARNAEGFGLAAPGIWNPRETCSC